MLGLRVLCRQQVARTSAISAVHSRALGSFSLVSFDRLDRQREAPHRFGIIARRDFCAIPGANKEKEEEPKKTENQERLGKAQELFRNYGPVGIAVYGGVYVGTLSILYGLVQSDCVGVGDAVSLLRYTGLDQYVDMQSLNPKAGHFAVAWVLTKFTEPFRLVLSISITPAIARALGRAPPKEKN